MARLAPFAAPFALPWGHFPWSHKKACKEKEITAATSVDVRAGRKFTDITVNGTYGQLPEHRVALRRLEHANPVPTNQRSTIRHQDVERGRCPASLLDCATPPSGTEAIRESQATKKRAVESQVKASIFRAGNSTGKLPWRPHGYEGYGRRLTDVSLDGASFHDELGMYNYQGCAETALRIRRRAMFVRRTIADDGENLRAAKESRHVRFEVQPRPSVCASNSTVTPPSSELSMLNPSTCSAPDLMIPPKAFAPRHLRQGLAR